jgi:Disulphide bond corrector protein DsbC
VGTVHGTNSRFELAVFPRPARLEAKVETLQARLQPLLERPPKQRWVSGPSTCHGYVWFYRRKADAATPSVVPSAASPKAAPSDSRDEPTAREPVVASLSVEPARAKPGDSVAVTVTLKLARDWHINAVSDTREFAIPTKLEIKLPSGIATAGEWDIPKPDVALADSGPVYTGEIRFTRSLKVDSSAQAGKLELVCKVSYQACDEHRCLRPTSKTVQMPLEIQAK